MARDGYRIFDAGSQAAETLGFLGDLAPYVAICHRQVFADRCRAWSELRGLTVPGTPLTNN